MSPADTPNPPTPAPAPSTAYQRRVLVVDDERDVATTIARLLKPTPVVFAQSAASAIGRITAGARFAAILCDLNMPGMNGMQFHDAVAVLAPPLARRIVYVTGSTGSRELTEFLRRTGCRCIEKPFEGAELRTVVAELLAQPDA